MNSPTFTLLEGDVLARLADLPDESVHCVVTSPPYWGLRDYGVDGQIGLEQTPELYVARMVEVFREVRRVLRSDGTFWLNIGDSYFGGGSTTEFGQNTQNFIDKSNIAGTYTEGQTSRPVKPRQHPYLRQKNLVGIPWRLAFALQEDGWYLRSEIIWAKPNPMPESVTDRPTKAHEQVFLLVKGQWKTRVVQFADLPSERFHLLDYLRAENPNLGPVATFCVRLASAIFDRSQQQDGLSLPPFYSEVWQQRDDGSDSDLVRSLPIEHRAAVVSARFLRSDTSAKEFLQEIDRLRIALADDGDLLVGGGSTGVLALPPGITSDGKTAVTVHHPGEICKFDFGSHSVHLSRPVGCSYFYDADAVREPATYFGPNGSPATMEGLANARKGEMRGRAGVKPDETPGRNLRSVWTIPTEPYPDAHFATYPTRLVEPCIKAGTSEHGCCPECGAPWERETRVKYEETDRTPAPNKGRLGAFGERAANMTRDGFVPNREKCVQTVGWRPTCAHGRPPVPCTVLDPFTGSGTTAFVALSLGRSAIGIELNPEYASLARKRVNRWDGKRMRMAQTTLEVAP